MCSLAFGDTASVELDMHQLLNEPINGNESECLEDLMIKEETELEDESPSLKDRVTIVVPDPLYMSD